MQKKNHILMLPSWYLPNGGQFVRNQAQSLCEKGIQCNVLANVSITLGKHKKKYFTLPWYRFVSLEDELSVYRFFHRSIPMLRKTNNLFWVKKTIRLFEKYKQEFGTPDIIHVHSALWAGYAAFLIKQKYNIPYIVTEHFSGLSFLCEYSKNQIKEWHRPYYREIYSNATYIVPVSDIIRPAIESFLIKEVPILPISNILDTEYFHYKDRILTDKIKFVATNGFYIQKGYDILIPAFDKACSINPNLEITIAGENFDKKEFQDTLWKQVKNKRNFHFVGEISVEKVRDELWKANVFILPSRAESQSVSTLEALSTGLPIVVTATIPKIMTTKDNSIVVPVEDVPAMTHAILAMSNNIEKYDGKSISEHIKSVCSKDVVIKAIINVYNTVLGGGND